VAARTATIAPGRIARTVVWRIVRAEEQKLSCDLYAAVRMDVDDHAQRAIEVVALLRSQVV
jgi:hypothetical protein